MERKPLFKTCRSWRLSSAGGSSDPLVPWLIPMRACCQSRMRRVSDASRKIDSCSGSSVRAQREALVRRGAEDLARRQPEHAPDVHERPQRAVLQTKDGRVLAGFVDHRILEERQRRQTRQAVVGQHVQEIAVHGAGDRGLDVVPERLAAVDRAQVEQGARQVHLRAHRVAQPLLVARLPFGLARHQERAVEGQVDSAPGSHIRSSASDTCS